MLGSRDHLISALDWWQEAGVDALVDELPRRWLAPPETKVAPSLAIAPHSAGSLDAVLAELSDPARFPHCGTRRLRPSGPVGAALMIVIDMPERADVDAGRLLAGPLAERFDRMFAALGLTREGIYLASLLPGRTPQGSIPPALFDEVRRLARDHVRLVAPRQLWLMGDAATRALLDLPVARASGRTHDLDLDGVRLTAIATPHPKILERDPDQAHAKRLWKEMQRLKDKSPS